MLLIVQFRAEAMLVTPELWPGLSYIRIVEGVSVSDNSGVNLSQAFIHYMTCCPLWCLSLAFGFFTVGFELLYDTGGGLASI